MSLIVTSTALAALFVAGSAPCVAPDGGAGALPSGRATYLTRQRGARTGFVHAVLHGKNGVEARRADSSTRGHAAPGSTGGGTAAASGACGPLVNGGFFNGLFGWDTAAAPGGPLAGSVREEAGVAILEEGESFLTSLSQVVCLPAGTTELRFDLISTAFDTGDTFIPDAFEVSLLDASFQSVVPTWMAGATSFFNVQEDGTIFFGPGVTVNGTRITLDLSATPPAADLLLTFDLIGADGDHTGHVAVDNIELNGDNPGTVYCEGVACPCGNDSPGTGCLNSLGTGGSLRASGSASLGADDLVLHVTDITPTFAFFFVGSEPRCAALGDGLVAVAPGPNQPGLVRILVQEASPDGRLDLGPGVVSSIDQATGMPGMITAGSTWYFQAVYRDAPASPCQQLFNFTNALSVTFSN